MDSCAAEIGLLKKKPCGHPAVARCDNCEMPLCGKHAVAQLSATKQRTGKFMCAECDRAQRAGPKAPPAVARGQAAPAAPVKPAAAKPSAPATPAAAAKAPAASAPGKPEEDSLGGIDFTPTKK